LGTRRLTGWTMARPLVVLHVKCPLLLSYFYLKLRYVDKIKQKTTQNEILWKCVQWFSSCYMLTDGQSSRR
jgi:hypothetical protein